MNEESELAQTGLTSEKCSGANESRLKVSRELGYFAQRPAVSWAFLAQASCLGAFAALFERLKHHLSEFSSTFFCNIGPMSSASVGTPKS